jgi:hypothetical protein
MWRASKAQYETGKISGGRIMVVFVIPAKCHSLARSSVFETCLKLVIFYLVLFEKTTAVGIPFGFGWVVATLP